MKHAIFRALRMSICSFRCDYCYLLQRESSFAGKQIQWKHSPEEMIRQAFSKERLGGLCYSNLWADGKTLLVKDIITYVTALLSEGHFVEIVTNMTVIPILDKMLSSLDEDARSRLSFKCSFYYLQLKEKGWLEAFARNVSKAWGAGCSATVEIVGADSYLPYIDEIKQFSMKHFGVLPHVTIARDDRDQHKCLTSLPLSEYLRIWGSFDSPFFEFKQSVFGKKRKESCYAGTCSMHVDMAAGVAQQCYVCSSRQNIYENIDAPIQWNPICVCRDTYCYNGHVFLTIGFAPDLETPCYGSDMRNRKNANTGKNWYNDRALSFFDSKSPEPNERLSRVAERKLLFKAKHARLFPG